MVTFKKFGKLGRFGNQLFQYAGVFLYAKKFGYSFSMPNWIGVELFNNIRPQTRIERLKSIFLPTRQLDDMRSWNKWGRLKYYLGIWKKLPHTYSMKKMYDNPEDNINFYGYMQDPHSLDLLKEHKNEILSLYKFKSEIDNPLKEVTKNYTPWIAIHIRRGDFVNIGTALSTEEYKEVLRKIANGRNVYIASDDPKIASEFSEFNTFTIKPPTKNISYVVLDFWMLANAQTVIGGGSTFSWWAAYLGNRNDYYSPPLTHLWEKGSKAQFSKQNI